MTRSGGNDWRGDGYDRTSDPQTRWGSDVVQRVPADLDGLVVDAGCGTGRVTEQLLERLPSARVLGLDASESMLSAARKRLARFGTRAQLRVHDLREALRLPEPATAVFSTGAFHWLHDHAALFESIRKALVNGGSLIAQAGGEGSLAEVMQIIASSEQPELAALNHYATVADTEAALHAAGFDALQVWLHPEPVRFESRAALAQFLTDAALGPHLERLEPARRPLFIEGIANAVREPTLQFMRLNIVARAGHRA